MTSPSTQPALGLLTEKEKQTLRLIVCGHDAKSIARKLDLSVHTINERLRDARRKLAVSSSREAARMLFEAEGASPAPESLGDSAIGGARAVGMIDQQAVPSVGTERPMRRSPLWIGALIMTLALGLMAFAALPLVTAAPSATTASEQPVNAEVVDAARAFLTLVEQKKWTESYAATGSTFRQLNTLQVWSDVSEQVHARYGKAVSRTLLSQENLPAPPAGYEVVKFRTVYANKAEAVETVTLDREDGRWVVVGVTIG
jgi:DNA-binding CsgD family transcriptional regulator